MKAATTTSAPLPVFVYGTLMNPEVVSTLLGRSWSPTEEAAIRPARLYGYTRQPVRQHVFPATIPSSISTVYVEGLLLPATLSKIELDIFDWFESDEYYRVPVDVTITANGNDHHDDPSTSLSSSSSSSSSSPTKAQVYLWRDDLISQLELDQDWSYENFCQEHLDWYLENTVRPCRAKVEQLGMTK
jgi:gamma-glutamylcyclotransferase (GGCT)/AIG2-like uncharacterized protein YtfP